MIPTPQARALALCGAILAVTLTSVTVMALPSADHLRPGAKRAANVVRQVLPEGWSFFTKSPRDAFVVAYDENGDEAGTAPNVQPTWAFGLNRTSRLGGIDIDRVMQKLDHAAWQRCELGVDLAACTAKLKTQTVRTSDQAHSLCGDVTLAKVQPTPWAFRGTDSPIEEVAVVRIQCTSAFSH